MIERIRNDSKTFYKPYQGAAGYQVLSVDGTVQTASPPQDARLARLHFRGGNVRMTMHGVDPTSSTGVPFYDGYEEWVSIEELNTMRITREGSTNGTVHIVYYK